MICPKCNGSGREPYTAIYGAIPCQNCGGQTMSMRATGEVPMDPTTGLGCLHQYKHQLAGNCYHIYTCAKCGDRYDIDSGD
jgi:hypothetical protein